MKFVSLFAGVGGFDLGLTRSGHECVGQVEIDKHARAVLDLQFPDVPKHNDVTTAIEWADEIGLTGNIDLVCGGFPCQDLSVAGKRAGLAGARSGLFYDALRFATHTKAKTILLENVPGLLSSNQGRDFGTVISGEGGTWRSLPMTEVYNPKSEHTSVEHIEFFNGGLFGDWYGSSGRGTLVYSWVGDILEGVDATGSQTKSLPKPWCSVYEFKWTLPIKRCDKGQPVQMIQESLNAIGYELIADEFFGNGTKFSIKYFQWSNELKITGEVDIETWRLLFKDAQLPGYDLDNNGVVTPDELSGG